MSFHHQVPAIKEDEFMSVEGDIQDTELLTKSLIYDFLKCGDIESVTDLGPAIVMYTMIKKPFVLTSKDLNCHSKDQTAISLDLY